MGTQPAESTSEAEFTKIQELLYELTVGAVMTANVVTLEAEEEMEAAKELMRLHRISGLPVMCAGKLAGVVSVEDVIRWLERGGQRAAVSKWMTRPARTIHRDDPAIQAVTRFGRTRVGRLPVLGDNNDLVGIVTPGDIMGRLLTILDSRMRSEERTLPESRERERSCLQPGATLQLRYPVAVADFERAGSAATGIKRWLGCLGFEPPLVRRVSIAAYEAEMNLAIHTLQGGTVAAVINDDELVIEASDQGPGIEDIEQAMREGFSTAPEWIRALGFGAGMGLNNIQRCADEFFIDSTAGRGTTVRASFLRSASEPDSQGQPAPTLDPSCESDHKGGAG